MLNSIIPILDTGAAAGGGNSYESIATFTVGSGGLSSLTFSSIPQTYKHLQIRAIARNTRAATGNSLLAFQFNGVTSGYTYHFLTGDGTSATAAGGTAQTYAYLGNQARANELANVFDPSVIDILDYTNTNKYKTCRGFSGQDTNGAGYVNFTSSLFQSTNAITQIDIYPADSTAIVSQYSQFALYGVK